MIVTTREVETGPRRRILWWVAAAAVLVAVALTPPAISWYRSHPHGDPDPGGRRLALLTNQVRRALPSDTSATHRRISKPSWDRETCDGGAPGWTRVEVDERFQASGTVVAREIDAALMALHWRPVRSDGGDAVRWYAYHPRNGPNYDATGTLYWPTRSSTTWDLELDAAPAEVPSHDC